MFACAARPQSSPPGSGSHPLHERWCSRAASRRITASPSCHRRGRLAAAEGVEIVGTLRRHGVGFKSLHEALDTTPDGRLIFHVFAALAEFIRELIVEGTREGLDAARARGACLGRPSAMTAEQIRHARDLLTRPDNTVSSIARLLGVSRATIYKYVPEVTTGRATAALPPGQE